MRVPERSLAISALGIGAAAGTAFVVLGLLGIPGSLPARGTLLGLSAGLFGGSLFLSGFFMGHRLRTPEGAAGNGADARMGSAVSPDEAKYWLRRFLEEHQRRERAQDAPDAKARDRGASRETP